MIRNRGDYWQVRVYVGLDPLTGKKRFMYDRASTRKQAEKLEARLVTEVEQGRHRGTGARTVEELIERWLEWRQGVKRISPGTLANYRRYIDQKILPALGRLPVRQLDVATIDRFYAELRQRGRSVRVCTGSDLETGRKRWAVKPGPLSPSAIRDIHAVLSGSLQRAVVWGWISFNPARLAPRRWFPSRT